MARQPGFYAAAFIVLIKDNMILLSQRQNTDWKNGYYGMVSGHFEDHEMGTVAVCRETKEEIGIVVMPNDVKFLHCQERSGRQFDGSMRTYFDIYFQAEKWDGEITNMEPEKCSDLHWFPLDQLPEKMVPGMREVIQSFMKGIAYSEAVTD